MIDQIKKLREQSGAGINDCKKALIDAGGDFDRALSLLQQSTAKDQDNLRIASKGLTRVSVYNDEAILFEVNGETDFLSKNPHFIQLLDLMSEHLMSSDCSYPKSALKVKIDGRSLADHVAYTSSLVKETLILRRFHRIRKESHHRFGFYMHQGGKISTLVIIDQDDDALAKNLSMHVAAMQPTYLSIESLDQETITYERMHFEKSHDAWDALSFDAFLKKKTLYDQPMIKYEEVSVRETLHAKNVHVIDFFRFELGQGIENKLNCRLDIPCDGSKITVTPVYENSEK